MRQSARKELTRRADIVDRLVLPVAWMLPANQAKTIYHGAAEKKEEGKFISFQSQIASVW